MSICRIVGIVKMKSLRAVVLATIVVLPAVLFWAVPLVVGVFASSERDGGQLLGGSRCPTRVNCFGCSYAPNGTGAILLLMALVTYLAVCVWWVHRATHSDWTGCSGAELMQRDRTEIMPDSKFRETVTNYAKNIVIERA